VTYIIAETQYPAKCNCSQLLGSSASQITLNANLKSVDTS
jgi:hypothetical protein